MSIPSRRSSFNRVLVDMNTQCDFLLPGGALPVANRAEILPNIRRLMNWGRVEKNPIVSSLQTHRVNEAWHGIPSHCVEGTHGQKKLPFTLMPRRILLLGDNTFDLPPDPFRRYQQVIFTKRSRDFLGNPKADRLLNSLDTHHLVMFGVVAEHCVKVATLGLMARQHRVVVVTDACGCWSAGEAELAFRQVSAKGAILVTTEELVSGQADERIEASRPMPLAAPDDEAAVVQPGDGNGNGKSNGNGHRIAASKGADGPWPARPAALAPDRLAAASDRLPPAPRRKSEAQAHPTRPHRGLA